MRRPLKRSASTRLRASLVAGSALADEEAIETSASLSVISSCPSSGSALADEEAIETHMQCGRGPPSTPAVPWPMRRPLKRSQGFTSLSNFATGSALADEEAIETLADDHVIGQADPTGSALADEEAIETVTHACSTPMISRQCLGR